MVKIADLLARRGVLVPYWTVHLKATASHGNCMEVRVVAIRRIVSGCGRVTRSVSMFRTVRC